MQSAPLHSDLAGVPSGGQAHWLQCSDGVRIRAAHWARPGARATIFVFTGRTEYIEKYGETIAAFLDRGFACVVFDWRGQGLSDRIAQNPALGHVRKFTDYQSDVAAVLDHAQTLALPQPFFVIGHSMGGAIALRRVMDPSPFAACGFSGPLWGIQASPALRLLGWTVSTLATWAGQREMLMIGQSDRPYVLQESFENNTLTDDQAQFERLSTIARAHPELLVSGPTMGWVYATVRETLLLSKLPAPDLPCLTYVGTKEATVDVQRIKARMDKWPNGTLRVVEGGPHEMLMSKPETRQTLIDGYCTFFAEQIT